MARVLIRSVLGRRHLLLALLALALALRTGAGCEALAATPTVPAAYQAHCVEMPTKPDKPLKADADACALCAALPDAAPASVTSATLVAMQPIAALHDCLAGLAGGPAPPPPKIT